MPLEIMKQLNRLYVDVFARIKALRVGSSTTNPGPGNLYVENNLTVEGKMSPFRHRPASAFVNASDPNVPGNFPFTRNPTVFPPAGIYFSSGGGWIHLTDGIELQWGMFECDTDDRIGINYKHTQIQRHPPIGQSAWLRSSNHYFPTATLAVTYDVTGRTGNLTFPYTNWWDNPEPGTPGVYKYNPSATPPDPLWFAPLSRKGFTYDRLNSWSGNVVVHYIALGY